MITKHPSKTIFKNTARSGALAPPAPDIVLRPPD
jgi:hypothetical protein